MNGKEQHPRINGSMRGHYFFFPSMVSNIPFIIIGKRGMVGHDKLPTRRLPINHRQLFRTHLQCMSRRVCRHSNWFHEEGREQLENFKVKKSRVQEVIKCCVVRGRRREEKKAHPSVQHALRFSPVSFSSSLPSTKQNKVLKSILQQC